MSSVKVTVVSAALAALAVGQARAADLPVRPPVVYQPAPVPVIQEFEGWYLRGDIGMSNQKVKSLDNALFATTPGFVWLDKGGFDSAPIFGLGIGYQFNDWLRADVTGEYRGKATFRALDRYTGGANDYYATKSEWLFLANAYVDLGTWWCITPFIGAGVGVTRNTISGFRDINVPTAGVAFGDEESKWQFAWAVHAGLAYKVNPNFTVELAYRYLDLGDAQSGDLITYLGGNQVNNPMLFKDITSHDVKLGLRWALGDVEFPRKQVAYAPPPAPVYVQPQQVLAVPPTYAPPPPPPVYSQPPAYPPQPTYSQPPLNRKG